MNNSQECTVWNSLSGAKISCRSCYDDLVSAGVEYKEQCLFIAFVPHDLDVPVFLDAYHFSQTVTTNRGRYFIADSVKQENVREEV